MLYRLLYKTDRECSILYFLYSPASILSYLYRTFFIFNYIKSLIPLPLPPKNPQYQPYHIISKGIHSVHPTSTGSTHRILTWAIVGVNDKWLTPSVQGAQTNHSMHLLRFQARRDSPNGDMSRQLIHRDKWSHGSVRTAGKVLDRAVIHDGQRP